MGAEWSKEKVARLKAAWDEGLSATVIGREFGCSRNAVIGKAHRLKLAPRACSQTAHIKREPKPRTPQQQKTAIHFRPRAEAFEPEPFVSSTPLSADDIPIKQRKQLLELAHDDCRWPYGDPGSASFFFCGGDTSPERPYCPAHCRIAFAGRPQLRTIARAPRLAAA